VIFPINLTGVPINLILKLVTPSNSGQIRHGIFESFESEKKKKRDIEGV
jgi:hypothetical protein